MSTDYGAVVAPVHQPREPARKPHRAAAAALVLGSLGALGALATRATDAVAPRVSSASALLPARARATDAVALDDGAGASQPHLVLLTVDDLGFNDIGYQSTDLSAATPTLTSLARAGVVLDSYYGQEMCTPARASILTGRWVASIGFQDTELTQWSTKGVPLRAKMLPQHLRELGYATHGFGKWNVGFCNESYLPWNRGFDSFLGYMTQGISYYEHAAGTFEMHGGTDLSLIHI